MKFKTFKDILLLKPAITSRNLVTLGLVLLFFGICMASGMKITGVPDVKPGTGFGGIERKNNSVVSPRDVAGEDSIGSDQIEVAPTNRPSSLLTPRERLEASIRESARERNPIRAGESQPAAQAEPQIEQPVRQGVDAPVVEEVREELEGVDENAVSDELSEIEKRLNLKNR